MSADKELTVLLQRLQRIADLEQRRAFSDSAVEGGLAAFLERWGSEAARHGRRGKAAAALARKMAPYQQWAPATRADQLPKFLTALTAAVSAPPGKRTVAAHPSPPPATREVSPRGIGDDPLAASVGALSGIAAQNTARLAKLGVRTVGELLTHYPRRYNDFSRTVTIAEAPLGDEVTLLVTVRTIGERRGASGRPLSEAILGDDSGTIRASWFTPYPARQLRTGDQVAVSGSIGLFNGRRSLDHPEYERIDGDDLTHTGRLVPLYPATDGLHQKTLRNATRLALQRYASAVPEILPSSTRASAGLLTIEPALRGIHFPESDEALAAARRRLAFDELFTLQLGMLQRRAAFQRGNDAPIIPLQPATLAEFGAGLPFSLTGAQQRVIAEISDDLTHSAPMSRLVQGDVGSGKTAVAAAALLTTSRAGYQGVMMAPTTLLAEQHARSLAALYAGLGSKPRIELITGAVSRGERGRILRAVASGAADIVVGTQAVIQDGVDFARLGLAIVDEQHRFGVMQRGALRAKAAQPHLLVMTATPIPRSLALTIYGDLDVSSLDEHPPGRTPITTRWVDDEHKHLAWSRAIGELRDGHQAFVVYPLVEESERSPARAATAEAERLATTIFKDWRVGLLHGRMKPAVKDQVMRAFQRHDLDVLVSTAVIEVGVDVPNATVMVIEGADRFGLAQLHQFRGRVGRGAAASWCFLVADAASESTAERLTALERTSDGQELAETDLRLRGPGDFLGTRQSGLPALKLASVTDRPLIEESRREAHTLFTTDPQLADPAHAALAARIHALWSDAGAGGDPS